MVFKNNQYIKITGQLPNLKYWYWNIKENRLINKFGKPKQSQDLSNCQYLHHPDEKSRFQDPSKTALQIGDIVYYFGKNAFGIVIKHLGEKTLQIQARNSKIFKCRRQSLYFLDPNIKIQPHKVEENLMLAHTKAEIDFAETIIGTKTVLKHMLGKRENWQTYPLNISTFLLIHKLMFRHLYPWAGKYRKEELVVGRFDSKTLPHSEIELAMKSCFSMLEDKIMKESPFTLESMSNLLTSFHKDIAWIHPFLDGNGRVVRWFCDMVAYRCNFLFVLKLDSPSRKRKYHQAVRKAVEKGNSSYLKKIFRESLSKNS